MPSRFRRHGRIFVQPTLRCRELIRRLEGVSPQQQVRQPVRSFILRAARPPGADPVPVPLRKTPDLPRSESVVVAGIADPGRRNCDLTLSTSVELMTPSAVVSPIRTPIIASTSLVFIPSFTYLGTGRRLRLGGQFDFSISDRRLAR